MDAEFDAHADEYDQLIGRGLMLAGERKEYFAERRVAWMAPLLARLGVVPRTVLDYGCGTGAAIPCLLETLGAGRVVGLDLSTRSLEVARRTIGGDSRATLVTPSQHPADASCDLAYTSGVFHHIPPADRAAALDDLYRRIRPGGLLAFWEHNRWHPGTQAVVWRIALDRDAVLISAAAARRLLRRAGFEPLLTHYLFVFPRALAWLRVLEARLARWPLGAQYLVLARRA